jgi:hypothetical protein
MKGAVLRLGSGKSGGDGGLYTGGDLYKVVNDGSLVLRNTSKALTLSRISGSGSLTQSGPATTTLTGGWLGPLGDAASGRTTAGVATRGSRATTPSGSGQHAVGDVRDQSRRP